MSKELKSYISAAGAKKLVRLLIRAEKILRIDASAGDDNAYQVAQAVDAWLDEWTKDDHPHAIRARASAVGALALS